MNHSIAFWYDLYENDGQSGVIDHVEKSHPEAEWKYCVPCESQSPVWDGVCAVCFTAFDGTRDPIEVYGTEEHEAWLIEMERNEA